jgi:hypothetical protein
MEFFPGLFLPAARDRWCARLIAGVRAFESTLGVSLNRAHSGSKARPTIKDVPDLREFFEGRLRTRNRWFSLFSGNGLHRKDRGFVNLDYYNFGGKLYGDESLFSILLMTPPLTPDMAEKLLVALGDALEIQAAQYTPDAAARRLRLAHWCVKLGHNVIRHPLVDRNEAEGQLPVICESTYDGLAPRQPHHFGWLNYWSPEVCAEMKFASRIHAPWISDSYLTPRGGRLFKLGAKAPLAEDDTFTRRLQGAYADFPKVARRLEESGAR